MFEKKVIAADIGGSHITSALVDLEQRSLVQSTLARRSISESIELDEVIESWADCVKQSGLMESANLLCLAMPGPFDYAKGICYIRDQAKYPGLYGQNIKQLLSVKLQLAIENIVMENDAACFIRGEVFNGSARGFKSVVAITLGTGLGSAIYKNGEARDADLWRSAFREGIAEDYISSRWFVNRYTELTGLHFDGVKQIVEKGSSECVEMLFAEFADNLAEFLQAFIARENAEAVVIGGNIARAFDKFSERLKNKLPAHIAIRQSILGEHAALLGAASCAG